MKKTTTFNESKAFEFMIDEFNLDNFSRCLLDNIFAYAAASFDNNNDVIKYLAFMLDEVTNKEIQEHFFD